MNFLLNKLSRFLLVFLLVSCMINLKSTCKAYTEEDLNTFLNQLVTNDLVDSRTRAYANKFISTKSKLYEYFDNNGYSLSEYKGFSIRYTTSGQNVYYMINCFRSDATIQYSSNTWYTTCDWFNTDNSGNITNHNTGLQNIASIDAVSSYRYFGLLDGAIANLNNNMYFENYYDPVPPFDYTPNNFLTTELTDNTLVYNIKMTYPQDVLLGFLGDNEYYQLRIILYDKYMVQQGELILNPDAFSLTDNNCLYLQYNTLYARSSFLYYYNLYQLTFDIYTNQNDHEVINYIYQFIPYSAIYSGDQIIYSGDTTWR